MNNYNYRLHYYSGLETRTFNEIQNFGECSNCIVIKIIIILMEKIRKGKHMGKVGKLQK